MVLLTIIFALACSGCSGPECNNQKEEEMNTLGASGLLNYGRQTLPFLEGSGMVNLNGTTVNGLTSIQGCLKAIGAIFKSNVQIQGQFDIESSRIEGPLSVQGLATIIDSNIQDCGITSNKVVMVSTTTKNITIFPTRNSSSEVLVIRNGTVVNGDVTFASGNGIIQNDGTAQINGAVRGIKS